MAELIKFNKPKLYTKMKMGELYPNCMYIMQLNNRCDQKGLVHAISKDEDTWEEICKMHADMQEKGMLCTLAGSYGGGLIGFYKFD